MTNELAIKILTGEVLATTEQTYEAIKMAVGALQLDEVKPIGYLDCSNAMLKMWIDKVVTDGEYNRIMYKLNLHWKGEK